MNNIDIKQLMDMLSKVDKKDLQASIEKANQIMNSNKKDEIINEIKNNLNKN